MVLSCWLATFRQNFRFHLLVQFTLLTALNDGGLFLLCMLTCRPTQGS
jgi:hypothetical protein